MARHLICLALVLALHAPLAAGGPKTDKRLTGEWESVGKGAKPARVEFTAKGKVHLEGNLTPLMDFRFAKPLKPFADFGLQPGRNLDITYRGVGENRLEIRAKYTQLMEKLSKGGESVPPEVVKMFHPTEAFTYAVTENELTLTNAEGKSLRLRRAK
jgi:hypothetical protein